MDERVAALLYSHFMSGKLNIADFQEKTRSKMSAHMAGMRAISIGQYARAYKVKTKKGNVAVMPVVGSLTKRGEMCSYGMRDYMNEIERINTEEEDISSIVLDMEGPGGTVDGTPEFGLTVKNSKKPVVVFGDNMVASANYWVASQSKWIVGNKNNPTEFGSIGTLCVHEYWGKFIEENIGEVKIIRAPQSVDKAKFNPIEALTPELENEIKADLKEITKEFLNTVKKGRGDRMTASESEWGTGKMFKTDEAMKMGLIDGVGTLMDAINKAAELANSSGTNGSSTKSNKQMSLKTAAKKVSSFFSPKKESSVKAAEEQPAAAEDTATPMWTEDLVFNTDGSGDGAFCIHADSDGNDREFETKTDENQGNEPPTDPAVTEDENWSLVVAEEATAEEAAEEQPAATTTVAKMNISLKKANAQVKTLTAEVNALTAKLSKMEKELSEAKAKMDTAAAGKATTVVSEQDPHKKENDQKKYRTKVDDEVDQYLNATKTPKQ